MSKTFLFLLLGSFLMLSCNKSSEIEASSSFCEEIHRNDTLSLGQYLSRLSPKGKSGAYVLEDGGNAIMLRAWLTEYAEKSIDIQYFIFSTDNVGLIACDYLVRAADRGIKVRLLIDDLMVDAEFEDVVKLDSHENIEIKVYNPGINLNKNLLEKIGRLHLGFREVNQRMHNKVFLADGQVAITGGRNIADEYFDYDHEYNFRDRDILLLGEVIQPMAASFEEFWNSDLSFPVSDLGKVEFSESDGDIFEKLHLYACDPVNFWPQVRDKIENLPRVFDEIIKQDKIIWTDSLYFISDLPGKNSGDSGLSGGGNSTTALAELVSSARNSIDIQSPYLVLDENILSLFKEAIAKGVKIRILTNSLASTDNLEAFSGYQRDRSEILKAGIKVYEFRPDAASRKEIMTGELQQTIDYSPIFGLHAKTMVIDGKITVIGTFNLDPRSANLNTECVAIVHSTQLTQGVLQYMEKDFLPENAWETTVDFNPDAMAGTRKNIGTRLRRPIPKDIL